MGDDEVHGGEEATETDDPTIPEGPPAMASQEVAPGDEPLPGRDGPSPGGPHMALIASRLLAWFVLALAVRHLVSVLGGGWRFWHLFQGLLLVWGTALLALRAPLFMEGFYRLPNAEAVLQRFGPKLRIGVASMILVALGQVTAGIFDMIIHGFRALLAALVVGAVMVAPAVLEYGWRDTWEDEFPPALDHWPRIRGPIGLISGLVLDRGEWLDRLRAASPAVVKIGALSFVCGALLFWGNGPFGNQWLGTSRGPEMDLLVCEDYTVRMGADAWEAQHVDAKEWSYVTSEPPECWVECVHRQWTVPKKRAANVDTLSALALLVGPKCCERCEGDYEQGTNSRNSYCCL